MVPCVYYNKNSSLQKQTHNPKVCLTSRSKKKLVKRGMAFGHIRHVQKTRYFHMALYHKEQIESLCRLSKPELKQTFRLLEVMSTWLAVIPISK